MKIDIIPATEADFDGIWEIFHDVVSTGDSYIYLPETPREEAHKIWMVDTHPFVAKNSDGQIVGTCLIRQNRIGLGSHVCNAAYMVHKDFRGQKIGEKMCRHTLKEAKKMGFHSMQFNIVVSTNHKAVALWMKMGFEVVGTVPEAFRHLEKGLVDAYVMHRFL